MDQLFRQLAGAGGAGGMGNLSDLFGKNEPNSQEENEELMEEDIMENAKISYDVFISNTLMSTSHSVQWLPYQLDDPEYPAFK